MTTTTKQVVTVTTEELVNILRKVTVNQFINLVTETVVSNMNKYVNGRGSEENPFYQTVKKLSSCRYRTSNYEVRLKNETEKNGGNRDDVQVQKPSGKHHVQGTECLLQSDKDENVFYLMVERFDEIKPSVTYSRFGNPIDKMVFEQYLKDREYDQLVSVITPLVSNIKSITFEHIEYKVEN